MIRCVVDVTVAVKWFVPESHAISANRLLYEDFDLFAPDLIFLEFGNVLWKKWCRGEITAASAYGIIEDFRHLAVKRFKKRTAENFIGRGHTGCLNR